MKHEPMKVTLEFEREEDGEKTEHVLVLERRDNDVWDYTYTINGFTDDFGEYNDEQAQAVMDDTNMIGEPSTEEGHPYLTAAERNR